MYISLSNVGDSIIVIDTLQSPPFIVNSLSCKFSLTKWARLEQFICFPSTRH